MVALENIKYRIKNIPGFLKAKVKGKPFHWTMTRKQMENKASSFQKKYNKRQTNKASKQTSENRRDRICRELERLEATNMPKYKNVYKNYCLSAANANVGDVNLNALEENLESENLNLPLLENPIQVANSLLDEATSILDSVNQQMMTLPTQRMTIADRVQQIKARQPEILAEITRGKELAEQAKMKAQTVPTNPNAPAIVRDSEELLQTFDSVTNELARMTEYSIQNARQNLRSGIRALGMNELRNLSSAYTALRGSSSTTNLSLLAEYVDALEKYQKRSQRPVGNRNRATRVSQMKMGPPGTVGKRYGYGGRRTRKV
jgi:chorismate mutase